MAVVGTSQCPITARASVISTLVGGGPAVAFGQAGHKLIQLAAVGETVSSEIENSGVEVERAKTFAVPLLQQCEQPMCWLGVLPGGQLAVDLQSVGCQSQPGLTLVVRP
jgi:hypothetical protein